MSLTLPVVSPATAAIAGSTARFAVRRIYCVGRNYADHVREMGGDVQRQSPLFFTKFADTLLESGSKLIFPPQTQDLQFEAELVIAVGTGGRNIPVAAARDHVFGYACGLDMTRRDLQSAAKAAGAPWDMGKNFTGCAPLGPILPVAIAGHPARGPITLHQNGVLRQQGDLSEMIWSCTEIIAHLSCLDTLAPGDLIFTGTPAGVGAVSPGDALEVHIAGLDSLTVHIGAAQA